jgi:predicted metalloendopeptidase
MRRLLTAIACAGAALAALPAAAADTPPRALACTDFYDYVNGAALASVAIPPDRARVGSFDALYDQSRRIVEQALLDAQRAPATLDTPGKRLVAMYYASGMDVAAIERNGLAPLAPLLARIDGLNDRSQLPALLAAFAQHRIPAPFTVAVLPDPTDKRRDVLTLLQSGLGLPDRDDYTREDARARALLDAYQTYRLRLAQLAGSSAEAAQAAAGAVYALEAELARSAMTPAQRRDPRATTHLHTPASLQTLAPGLDWRAYFAALGAPEPGEVNVTQPRFVQAVARAAATAPLATWRAYLRQHLLDAAAPRLPQAYVDAHFAYRSGAIRGIEQPPPRSERVIDAIGGRTGTEPLAEGLGQLYVAQAFSPQAKARAVAMVDDIKAALRARIERLDWMSAPTKARAQRKLDAMALKIGYPDRWKDYAGLRLAPDDYAGNWLRANAWDSARRLGDLQRPVDRSRWFTSPHIVNAFAGGLNDIVFPAAILQPPFFDLRADDALNLGGIGAVIGHEITHHFDDRGRQFDEFGNLSDWWTAEDAAAYRARAAQLARQYSGYAPVPGYSINGEQTLGENISDLGGLKMAYDALQRAQQRQATPPIDGFTPQQRFFLSYATIWRSKLRTEALLDQLRTGNHSPPRYRVLGALGNVPAFAQAFDCPPDAPMLRAAGERVTIW